MIVGPVGADPTITRAKVRAGRTGVWDADKVTNGTKGSTEVVDCAGDFATHLTVLAEGTALDDLAGYAAGRGLTFTHIVLGRGRSVSQPTLTLRGTCTTLGRVWTEAADALDALTAAGFGVARVKIEAALWNEGVPRSDAAARALPAGTYFENRVKLLLPPGFEGDGALAETVGPHRAQLSRNSRRVRPDGRQERFVTQRWRGAGADTAGERLEGLLATLRAAGHRIEAVQREFVVHDSDESLDAGWIDEGSGEDSGEGPRRTGARGKSAGTKGKSTGTRGQSAGTKGQSAGTRGRGTGTKGKSTGTTPGGRPHP